MAFVEGLEVSQSHWRLFSVSYRLQPLLSTSMVSGPTASGLDRSSGRLAGRAGPRDLVNRGQHECNEMHEHGV